MRPSDQALLALLTTDLCRELSRWLEAQQSLGAAFLPQWHGYQSPVFKAPKPSPIQAADIPEKQVLTPSPKQTPASTLVEKEPLPPLPAQAQTPVFTAPKNVKTEAAPRQNARQNARPIATYKALRAQSNVERDIKTPEERHRALLQLEMRVQACRQCELGGVRRGTIFGFGPRDASIAFVFTGANPLEYDQSRILTGAAVALFERFVQAMAVLSPEAQRDRIYMTNVIKCAATPARENAVKCAQSCLGHLREQMRLLQPKVIIACGGLAYRSMFGGQSLLAQARGQSRVFEGIPTIPTHHPLDLVKNPKLKERVWQDLRLALDLLKP